jgi:hypothetical protein
MRSATAVNTSINAAQMERSAMLERSASGAESRGRLSTGREEVLLNLDLSDLVLPKVNDLNVDGLKSSWLSRLFGKN